MSKTYAKLFEPCQIGTLTLKNRISMAPMGLAYLADANGGFSEDAQEYYIERAKGGTGLIITGICCVDYSEINPLMMPCPTYHPKMFQKTVKAMNERIHAYDAKIFLQLTGGLGRSAFPGSIHHQIAPSPQKNRFDPSIIHQEMSIEEIHNLVQSFIQSSVIAKQCGFDGIEIHAVHEGYLLDQFATSFYNKRTDEYGGDLKGRLRLAIEIIQGIKHACGSDFPVSLRYSLKSFIKDYASGAVPGEHFEEQGKDIDEGIQAAKILCEAGYDCLNVDAGTYDSWYWNHPPMYFEKGMYREFGRILKSHIDVPVILAGRMDNPDMACEAIGTCCDLVSYGRPLLADPYLPQKIRLGKLEDIRPCLSCHDGCLGRISRGLPLSCAVNPQCGQEKKRSLIPAVKSKKVLIIGGGPAGLETARVCALRGHQPVLYEKSSSLGGNIRYAGIPDFKEDDRALINWYEHQLKKLQIPVFLNTEVTKEMIETSDADVIITATGSSPVIPTFPGSAICKTAEDILSGKETAGSHVLIIGGGLVGCETALWLVKMGKKVTILELASNILGPARGGIPVANRDMLKDLLNFYHVEICCNCKIQEIQAEENQDIRIIGIDHHSQKTWIANTAICAVGYRSENTLASEFQNLEKEFYNIGDSRQVKSIMQAIWEGFEVASAI